jgi:hypothetical protein
MRKIISMFILGLLLISCGPSPESMAKKTCALTKKFREAEEKGDSIGAMNIVKEIEVIENKIKEDHKSNADWLNTYSLNRDACIIEDLKKEGKWEN